MVMSYGISKLKEINIRQKKGHIAFFKRLNFCYTKSRKKKIDIFLAFEKKFHDDSVLGLKAYYFRIINDSNLL